MASFAAESVIDMLAQRLQIDPLELRLLNAADDGTQAAYGPVFRNIGYRQTLLAARNHPHYKMPLKKIRAGELLRVFGSILAGSPAPFSISMKTAH
jgi:Aerobic-type carbon monoxide dehydrogenase, large subunit CoxL/CutL homologs